MIQLIFSTLPLKKDDIFLKANNSCLSFCYVMFFKDEGITGRRSEGLTDVTNVRFFVYCLAETTNRLFDN